MRRKVVKDFTFSNGITVPAGTHIAVATNSTHMDEVRRITQSYDFSLFDVITVSFKA